ncbi:MAG: hypothetical protein L0Y77_12980 [Chlorobi bacterium]|nr:hypothetical protein [Chlorobiota bacterium]
MPSEYKLYQNYPNPFNPVAKIRFELPVEATRRVALIVFDVTGREIETLVNEELNPGVYEIQWDAANYPSGYIITECQQGIRQWTDKFIRKRRRWF